MVMTIRREYIHDVLELREKHLNAVWRAAPV